MGACEFTSYAYGKTVEEAFRAAVDQAHYDHGHAGYSGTIAEKPGAILFPLPTRTTVQQVQDRAWDAQCVQNYDQEQIDARRQGRKPYEWLKKPTAKQRKALEWLTARFGARTEKLLWALDNKWDECAAFELRGAEKARIKDSGWHIPGGPHARHVEGKWVTPRTTKKLFVFVGFASS